MKKIGLIIFLVLSFLLLTNCNKDKKKETVVVEYENKNPKIKFSDDTYKLFEEFSENKKEIMEKLKTLNKDEANKLYEQYVEDNENILYKIGEATEKFLDSIYYGSAEEQFTEKDWNDTNKILNKYDLELWDIGEGMVTIRELPHLYYDLFKDYVTDDYKEYLKIWAKDNEELYQADAGLMISFEELGERIITWENFLNKFPNSTLKQRVNDLLNSYREDYILGMDNTPTIDGGYDNIPITIDEDVKKEYDRFIKKYPNSPTVELIKYFIENYKNENIYELIKNKIFQKFEKDQSIDVISENLGKMIAIKGNYENYILADNNWIVDLSEGYIYSGEKKYPIQIIGISSLKEDESETWTWAWEYSDNFNEKILTFINNIRWMGRDLKLGVFYNSKLKLSDEVNANILSIIACGISGENLAFDNLNLAYTDLQGTLYYAIKDLPNEVFSPVDLREFSDIIVSSIDRYTLNHKLFIESFLEWNKTKYKWQGNSIIADFGKDGELKIDFEKVGDKLIFKELKN
ncbi:DUF6882 domain-containing protein [Fusobacterium polymorphum]|uniref:Uncharacterized protein n=1 Tax=Fusobacterium nucleatum CTI-6 TaxID=1316587 RepID=U7TYJ2_FUSNU|nr:DUF6882 domain-containing protein [Fusobacterium nucleatum]ERT48952.1 hypothetical protein HMPREF1767_00428 [Fusobacterium nucleatum CTI-6]